MGRHRTPNSKNVMLSLAVPARVWGLDVPIRQILAKDYGAFSPEDVETLAAAFEAALGNLGLVDRNDPATALLAQVVIRLAKEGERDPKRLAEKAIGVVRGSN
jgi:hypothetical protein